MAFHLQDIQDVRFWACSTLSDLAAEQVEAIYTEAFPDVEREPFENLRQGINEGSRWLHCGSTEEGVVGFGVTCPFMEGRVVFLEYYAIKRTIRSRGVGTQLLQAIIEHLKESTDAVAIALEVESDEYGPPDERQLRGRRIGFYMRNGARMIKAVTDYRMPNMIGPGSFPMKLLWLPLRTGVDVPQGEPLKELILNIYSSVYHRCADDPLVQAILASINDDALRLSLWGDFDHDGVVEMEHRQTIGSEDCAIVLPVPDLQKRLVRDSFSILGIEGVHPAELGKVVVHVENEYPPGSTLTLGISGPARDKAAIFRLSGTRWMYLEGEGNWTIPCDTEFQGDQIFGLVSRAFVGENGWNGKFVLEAAVQDGDGHRLTYDAIPFQTAPSVLASALDQVESVLVVDNPRSANLVAALRSALAPLGVDLDTVSVDDGYENDVWIQDAVEIGRVCAPSGQGVGQAVAILPGIRAKHEGIHCGPLDSAVRDHFQQKHAFIADVAEPREGKDWIDWFGNLEVSPPVIARNGRSFPLGRVLTGRQGSRSMHPKVMTFLEAQRVQWPPLVVDTSWLEIGHVDEVINFVPAADVPGFCVLFPSVRLARDILVAATQRGLGMEPIFAGHQYETTVRELLEGIALSEESQRIQEILTEIKAQLCEGLGIEDAHFVELPALFRGGEAVIPNLVNSLVVGQHLFAPDPLGPVIAGKDAFAEVMTRPLGALGLKVHFVDVWDYYHLNAGEIHCGTNAVRRIAHPRWWLHLEKGQDK